MLSEAIENGLEFFGSNAMYDDKPLYRRDVYFARKIDWWVAEFGNWSAAAIHRLADPSAPRPRGYPPLIVDQAEAKGFAVQMFRGWEGDCDRSTRERRV